MKVLVVEDDTAVGSAMVRGLGQQGFAVRWATTGRQALELAAAETPEAVLLDLGLPDGDGLDVCRALRQTYSGPIIVVSARSDELDRVVGLEIGADDYVVKPVGLREIVARIRAVHRRTSAAGGGAARTTLSAGSLALDARTHSATMDGEPLDLTPTEWSVLAVLAQDPGSVVRREDLVSQVWGRPWPGDAKTVDVHVAALRRKLGDPAWILTVRGIGLRLVPPTP